MSENDVSRDVAADVNVTDASRESTASVSVPVEEAERLRQRLNELLGQRNSLEIELRKSVTELAKLYREELRRYEKAIPVSVDLGSLGRLGIRKSRRSSLPARYVNPENPEQKWSGRGRRPQWFVALQEQGRLHEAEFKESAA
jgi:DNA-binding protein H-NS